MTSGYLLNHRGERILDTVYRAENTIERMRGLLGRKALDVNEGFWLEPCNSVHTLFMGYSIDVLFIGGDGALLKTVTQLSPWRIAGALNARATLELQAGSAALLGLIPGEHLAWRSGAEVK